MLRLVRHFSWRRVGAVKVLGFMAALGLLGGLGWYWYSTTSTLSKHNDLAELEVLTILNDPRTHQKLIRTAGPDYRYNCHGWSFTRGAREVHADEVQRHLEQEYVPTEKPALNDIVVYRDHYGEIMHSGVVTAVGQGGLVIVESKWGTAGRFLHEPNISRSFTSFSFYHRAPELAKLRAAKGDGAADKQEAETFEGMDDDQ